MESNSMKRLVVLGTLLILLLISAAAAFAAPQFEVVIEDGEVINNDVVLFNDNLEIQSGAVVNSDVTLINGTARIAGTVNGDVTVFNGKLEILPGTTISGDCVLLSGTLRDPADGAATNCTVVAHPELAGLFGGFSNRVFPAIPPIPPIPAAPEQGEPLRPLPDVPSRAREAGIGFLAAASSALLLGMLAMVVAAAIPRHLQRVQAAARQKPFASGGVGVLTVFAVPSLLILLTILSALLTLICIGLLGFPLVLALAIAFVAALCMGWVTVGTILGQWLLGRHKEGPARLSLAAGAGTAVLTFVFTFLPALLPFPFGLSLVAFALASVGLGAVTLTQFGRKPYPALAGGRSTGSTAESTADEDKVRIVLQTLPEES
jgi:hypothetical protein